MRDRTAIRVEWPEPRFDDRHEIGNAMQGLVIGTLLSLLLWAALAGAAWAGWTVAAWLG